MITFCLPNFLDQNASMKTLSPRKMLLLKANFKIGKEFYNILKEQSPIWVVQDTLSKSVSNQNPCSADRPYYEFFKLHRLTRELK